MNILECIRKIVTEELLNTNTVLNCWPTWKTEIEQELGNPVTGQSALNLGDKLSEIFQSTTTTGRSQGAVSGGGYAWESLVTWYLNLISANTRMVAFKKMSMVPEPIRNAITVNYGNIQCNTEADITVVIFPESFLDFEVDENELTRTNQIISFFHSININTLEDFEVGIVQCKTNWNDNAQVPMLWNMVYSANNFTNTHISVGTNGFTIRDFLRFTYSFATVPSNGIDKYNITSTSVLRVNTLSGGNYWGHPSSAGISNSIKEIFNRNFINAFPRPITQVAEANVNLLQSDLSYFQLY